jgi:putative Holliday junction resolvase
MRIGRRIAFDFGKTRIGVAICDPDGILSTPLPFIANHGLGSNSRTLRAILALLEEYQPVKIYLGEPRLLSGGGGDSVELVAEFKRQLASITEVPVDLIDERFSTVSASRKLIESGVRARDSKEIIDSMAAVEILEIGLRADRGDK